MYRIMICDDNATYLSKIASMTMQYIQEYPGHFSEPVLFDNPMSYLDESEKGADFDVYLLDIFMPGINGIELAKDRRLCDCNAQLIFITTTREFAVEAIALSSTHYLVKPFSYEQLRDALHRAYKNLKAQSIRKVTLKSRDGKIFNVNICDIISVECLGHVQKVVCSAFSFEMRDSLPYLRENVFDNRFFQIQKGIIVNMDHISFVGTSFIRMIDGRLLPATKRNMPDFKKKYIDYTVGG